VRKVRPQPSGEILDEIAHHASGPESLVGATEPFESEIKQWLARELHDTVSSTLTTMLIQMEQLKVREEDPSRRGGLCPTAEVHAELESFQNATRQALHNVRKLVYHLRQDEFASAPSFAHSLRGVLDRFAKRTGIACRLAAGEDWPGELGSEAAQNLLRIAQEALQNVHCHSAARSVEISLESIDAAAIMTIRDDGIGFDSAAANSGGFGLLGMRERAALLGGGPSRARHSWCGDHGPGHVPRGEFAMSDSAGV
jgi:signal transduction histidine kinase